MFGLIILMQTMAMTIQLYASIYPSMTRMTNYFFIFIVISVPYLVTLYKDGMIRLVIYIITMLFAILFMLQVYEFTSSTNSNSQGVIPYVFIDNVVY